jgi:hypothetical protein
MNRVFILALVGFASIVGLSLVSNDADAGHRRKASSCCSEESCCSESSCSSSCSTSNGCYSSCSSSNGCYSSHSNGCYSSHAHGCYSSAAPAGCAVVTEGETIISEKVIDSPGAEVEVEDAAPVIEGEATSAAQPFGFRTVSFRR